NKELLSSIKQRAQTHPKVKAIGEIGLDYHYDFAPRETQLKVFHSQIKLAIELGKPIIVHNRESSDDVWAILKEYYSGLPAGNPRGQLHCFSESVERMRSAVALGFHISFTGNITFKNSTLSDVVKETPLDKILLETDSPYLAPVPHRGKRNMPKFLPLIARKVAEIKEL